MTETIVAPFNSASAASAALQDLEKGKIPSAAVRSYTRDDPDYAGYKTREPNRRGGFWSRLLGEEPTNTAEYDAYDTSLAAGHTVVTVTVDENYADAVVGIINKHRPTEIHDHGASQSGVAAQDAGSVALTNQADFVARGMTSPEKATGKEEEVIPLAEEDCRSASAPLIAAQPRSDVMLSASRSLRANPQSPVTFLRLVWRVGATVRCGSGTAVHAAPCIPPVGVESLRGWYLEGMLKEPVSAEARWCGGLFGNSRRTRASMHESAPPDVSARAIEGELHHLLPPS